MAWLNGSERQQSLTGFITAEDSNWKQIQQKVFARWCKIQFKLAKHDVQDSFNLKDGFKTGVNLIVLVECLSNRSVNRPYSRSAKPEQKHQCIGNLTIAFDFIDSEKIRLVNIGKFVC